MSTFTGVLPVVRIASVATGTALLLVGVRVALRGRRADEPTAHLGRVVLAASRFARPISPLHRAGDSSVIPTRLALSPECWPALSVAAAVRQAERTRPESGPPGLAHLIAGVRLLSAAAGTGAVVLVFTLLGLRAALIAAAVVLPLSTVLPDASLASAARRSKRIGEADTAAAVDLLAATTAAGLSLAEAMVLTAGHAPPAIAAALRAAAVRRALGEEPRSALADEADRYGVPTLAGLARAVERQRRLGVELGPELAKIASRLRTDHRRKALERAARRGPLGTVVIATVIAPLCLASIIACVVGGLVQGGTLAPR